MNVLFISHHYSLFGANRSLLALIDGVRVRKGVRLQVIVSGEGAFSAELKRRGVGFTIVPFQYNTYNLSEGEGAEGAKKSAAVRPMLEVVAAFRPDIVYSNSSVIYYGAWISKITKIPHVWHVREYGDLDYGLGYDFGKPYLEARLNECAAAIAISRSVEQHQLAHLDASRRHIIYNGVARTADFAAASRTWMVGRTPRLGMLGLIQPSKGHHRAIAALRSLRESYPDIQLLIGGSGDPRHVETLKTQAMDLGVLPCIRFDGYVDHPLRWLRENVDLLLMCSDHEGFGRVTAEAMTQAIPVIGTATGGTGEVIEDGLSGYLFDGSPGQLAARVRQAVKAQGTYDLLSANALAVAKRRFATERYADEVFAVLEQVAGRSSPPRVLPPTTTSPLAAEAVAAPFLRPPMDPSNCDLHWVRSSILNAVKQAIPLFNGVLLDVGCGMMPYRELICRSQSQIEKYIGLDIDTDIYRAVVDLRWDGRKIPLPDASVDCAMATEVLEHCSEPWVVLKEIRRVLKPGGVFFFTVPYIWPLHDAPNDFFRYTPFALRKLLAEAGFEDGNIQALGGWNASLAQVIGLWLKRAPMSGAQRQNMLTQLWPLYQQLVASDELPTDPNAGNTMATGWSGTAFAPSVKAGSGEVGNSALPIVLIRCHEAQYSETFIDDHVRDLSRNLIVLHGIPFPRFQKGSKSVLADALEEELRAFRGGPICPELWTQYTCGLSDYLQRSGARVVLVETGLMGAFVHEACELCRIPYVVHFHGVDATGRDILDQWGAHYRRFFQTASALVVVSRAMRQELLKLGAPENRVVVAPYGVEVNLASVASPDRAGPQFLAVGRFVEKKGPQKTLQAFRTVYGKVPAARLVMVGDGPLLRECREWVAANGLADVVTFAGVLSRTAVSKLMSRSRAFVQHSVVASDGDSEGLPLAILEAGAHGLPVVSTRHAGIPDAVTEGDHGYLVDEGDVLGMAQRMTELALDSKLAVQLGAAFRHRVCAEFSREVSIRRLQSILAAAARE